MRKNVTIVVLAGLLLMVSFTVAMVAAEEKIIDEESTTPRIVIQVDSAVTAGTEFTASIMLPDTTDSLGGFSLLLEYDFDAVAVDSAVRGSLIAGEWEYFTYRTDLLPDDDDTSTQKAYLRIVAIADQHDEEEETPSPRSKIGAGELVRIHFYATEHDDYVGKKTKLRFRWNDCRSNSLSDPSGNQSYLSNRVYAPDGSPYWRGGGKYSGADPDCFRAVKYPPLPYFDFHNAEFRITQRFSPAVDSAE